MATGSRNDRLRSTTTVPVVGTDVVQVIVAELAVMSVTWTLAMVNAVGEVPLLRVLNCSIADWAVCVSVTAFTLKYTVRDDPSPVKATAWSVPVVVSLTVVGRLRRLLVACSTLPVEGMLVVQVIVAPSSVIFVTWILEIANWAGRATFTVSSLVVVSVPVPAALVAVAATS